MNWTPLGFGIAAVLVAAGSAAGQEPDGWNAPRALELMERARHHRARPAADSGLSSYRSTANGYIYFYLDREDSDERTLVKVDQLALEVYWAAPNQTKQRIVGLREAKKLPSRIHYHLDHLTVVQNEFDDRIRMGNGDEVRDVLHPAAPGSDSVYDFRLADSLSLRLPGSPEPIRVYEVEVRPRRTDRAALIGSVYLDRRTAAIVRMAFTFTPASYVDPRLDYIRISLDNGLWGGRYWLPNEQRIELRRQVPLLDFPAGGVIRGVLHIGDYQLNPPLPVGMFRGPRVVALPPDVRENYDFDAGIFAGLDDEGLGPLSDLAALRRRAAELIGRRYLSGLPRLRLFIPNASSALRYNRAEGAHFGAGTSYEIGAAAGFHIGAGYASGPGHLSLAGGVTLAPDSATQLRLRAGRNLLRDMGIRPGAAGVVNTLHAAFAGEDYLDPYYASGASLGAERRLNGNWTAGLVLGYHQHRSAELEQPTSLFDDDARFRPVRPVDEGGLYSARLALHRTAPLDPADGWSGALSVEAGTLEGNAYLRPMLEATIGERSADHRTAILLRGAAGFAAGDVPAQRLFLLGGRATLPGYRYRGFAGDRFALAELEASREIAGPWIRLRALGAIGWTGFDAAAPPPGWDVTPADGARTSIGLGLGLIYDILRVDFVRGLNGGRWRTILSVHPRLHDML